VVTGDFVSLNAFRDPSNIEVNPLVVAPGGIVTVHSDEHATIRTARNMNDMLSYRMNWPPPWRGDGSQRLALRLTPQAPHTGAAGGMMVGVVPVDRGGDTLLRNSVPVLGVKNQGTSYTGFFLLANEEGTLGGTLGTIVLCDYLNSGPQGDESTSGNPGGQFGAGAVSVYKPGDVPPFKGSWSGAQPEINFLDQLYPCLVTGWSTLGGNSGSWPVKVEWAIVETHDPGIF
jgi:hypothetical protein